jgi:NAD(P)-dependent dehydrogenase (short-subunit alcohol dehydrogenase family)
MTQPLTGSAVILGASKEGGTGWAIAENLAARYRHLTVGARRREGVEKLASRLNATAVGCDVTIEPQVQALASAAVAAAGPIDAAILVAGEGVRGYIDDIPESELHRSLSLNLVGPVYFLRHMARRMN